MNSRDDALDDADLQRNAVSGAKWMAAQKWYTKFAGLATTLLLARLLQPADFGLVALAAAFVGVASVITEAGFTPSLVRAVDVSDAVSSTAFWISIAISVVATALIQAVCAPLSGVLGEPALEPLLRTLSLLLPITALSSVQLALLSRRLKMRSLAIRESTSVTAGAIAGVGGALAGWGAWALVAQVITAALVGVIVLWGSTSWRPQFVFSRSAASVLLRQGGAALGTNLVHQVRDRGDEFLIGSLLGPQALGYWSVGTKLVKIAVDLFYSVVSGISFPVLSKVFADRDRFARAVQKSISLNLYLILPTLVGLALTTPLVVPLLFGSQWTPAVVPAQIYTLAITVGVFQWLDSQVWWAQGRFRTELAISAAISAFHLVSVAFACQFGLVAVALAILLRTCLTAPIRLMLLMRFSGLTMAVYRNIPGVIGLVVVMAGSVWGVIALTVDWPTLARCASAIFIGLVMYGGLSLAFRPRSALVFADLALPKLGRLRGAR